MTGKQHAGGALHSSALSFQALSGEPQAPSAQPRTVLTYGIFEQFDTRTTEFLGHLTSLGGRLIVGVASDAHLTAQRIAYARPFAARSALVAACRHVDLVIPEHDSTQKRTDIVNHNVAIFVMPERWRGRFDTLNDITQVIYLTAFPDAHADMPKSWAMSA